MNLLQKGKETVIAPSRPQEAEPTLPEYVLPVARQYARRYLRSAASPLEGTEDFEQDLVLHILKRLSSFAPEEPQRKAQILHAMKLRAYGLHRKALCRLRHAPVSLDAILEGDHDGEEPGLPVAPTEQDSEFSGLSPSQREICERANHESVCQIARDMQIPHWRIRRSIQRIARTKSHQPSKYQPTRSGDQP